MVLSKSDVEDSPEHVELTERLRKTLYYGKLPDTDRPSLPVTEIAVEFLQDAAPRSLGQVDNYLAASVSKKACMSPCSLMLGMLYIERLKHRNPEYLQQVSSSDAFLISMMVASKYLYDEGVEEEVFNDEWAESANMDVDELNELERNFLAAIDWNLFVKPDEFWKVLNAVERRIARAQGLDRGFFTYSDLLVLNEDGRLYQAFQYVVLEVCKVMLVCSMAYVAATLTMVGSAVTLMYVKQHAPQGLAHVSSLPEGADWLLSKTPVTSEDSLPDLLAEPMEEDFSHNHTFHMGENSEQIVVMPTVTHGNVPRHHSFSGLMTLVLIKDTVLQFVLAVKEKFNDSAKEKESVLDSDLGDLDSDLDGDVLCSCGCCIMNIGKHCWNVSSDSFLPGQPSWKLNRFQSEDRHLVSKAQNGGLRFCGTDTKCHCCCSTGALSGLTSGYEKLRSDSPSKVHASFYDVMVGFGTSTSSGVLVTVAG